MSLIVQLVTACVLIMLASLVGGWVPLALRLTHRGMEIALSFVSGVMLGVGLLEMLPEAWAMRVEAARPVIPESGAEPPALEILLLWLLGGFLVMFLVERFFCFHHHEPPEGAAAESAPPDQSQAHHAHGHRLTWAGAALGLTLHSLIAGAALAASVAAGDHDAAAPALAGLGTFLVIVLHKPFDSLTLGSLMAAGGFSRRSRHVVNGLFALAVPAGVGLFQLGMASDLFAHDLLISNALAFSAGMFLCISLSDLLPELQFHQHDRLTLSAALLLGLAVAWGVSRLHGHG